MAYRYLQQLSPHAVVQLSQQLARPSQRAMQPPSGQHQPVGGQQADVTANVEANSDSMKLDMEVSG